MTREVYNSDADGLEFWVWFPYRATGDEWESSCFGKAGEDKMSLKINTK